MSNLMKFTIQLAMLSNLLDTNLITRQEFLKIKADLESKFKIKYDSYS